MSQFNDADYDDWLAELRAELKARNIDIRDAFDGYNFLRAYEEYGLKPRAAVEDYLVGMTTRSHDRRIRPRGVRWIICRSG